MGYICRYGHNELDDPTITLPVSYQAVAKHPPVVQQYTAKLDDLGLLDSSELHTWQVASHLLLPSCIVYYPDHLLASWHQLPRLKACALIMPCFLCLRLGTVFRL